MLEKKVLSYFFCQTYFFHIIYFVTDRSLDIYLCELSVLWFTVSLSSSILKSQFLLFAWTTSKLNWLILFLKKKKNKKFKEWNFPNTLSKRVSFFHRPKYILHWLYHIFCQISLKFKCHFVINFLLFFKMWKWKIP